MVDRANPGFTTDEHTMLAAWLDFYRATVLMKCEGLDDEQLRTASAPPSPLTLLGLLQHLAEVERNWFRRVLAGEATGPIYSTAVDASGHDGGFEVSADSSFRDALAVWQDEVAHARANCVARDVTDSCPFMGAEVSLRWIYIHMIAEYARHCGQADLIRERIDGVTGV
ncbi:Mini-circle protein [Mycobacterium sp. WY10]|nr:Mini-circle protein [Mycobacterium sp. WY10]